MNPSKEFIKQGLELHRALTIRRTLGVRSAAGYMRRKGWSLEAALWWLTRPLVGVAK